MYKIKITFSDGTIVQREVFGRIRAYAIYYSAKNCEDVKEVQIKGSDF